MGEFKITIYVILLSASFSLSWMRSSNTDSLANDLIYRLPEILVPTFYDLSLTIDPAMSDFSGNVHITFDVTDNSSEVKEIYIHSDKDYITIKSITLNNNINCDAGIPNEVSILTVNCSKGATGQNNSLYIEYTARFSTDGYGMFKSTYMDQRKELIIIESVFEPIYARRAFPCFDEPDFRANFSIEVEYPTDYTAISNSPTKEEIGISDDLFTTRFDVTPKISPHLVSILISKLHVTNLKSDLGYDFKVITRADVANLTSKVLGEYYGQILEKISDYIGIPYNDLGDTECYQVALPEYSDTAGGFGLFTYRETDLLDDGDKTTHRATQDIITNIAYKLVHEWYGGDLTVKWWSDIWTNEAIATYIAYNIADEINDAFDLKNQFIVEVVRKSMQYDAYPFSQPLSSDENDVEDLTDITNKLDRFNLDKGASILRMIKYLIGGEDKMKSTLAHHWMQRNETDTNGSDLLTDLTENTHIHSEDDNDLYSYLTPWVFSSGYPLLTAKIADSTGTGVEVIRLYQKRFVYPTNDIDANDDVQWVIPLNSATDNEEQFYINVKGYYLPQDENYFFYYIESFLMFNVQSGFFYRVNYDELMWKKLIKSLNNEKTMTIIDTLSRSQLVDDIFNIARTGDVSYTLAFQLADFLERETEYYPWYTAFDAFSYIFGKIEDDVIEKKLKTYVLGLMNNVLKMVNVKAAAKNETHMDVLKRVMVLKWACKLGHTESVNHAVETFKAYKEDESSLDDYNLRGVIYCNGIRYSENVNVDWEFLWNVYTTSLSVHEQKDILNALGCAENEEILKSYLLKIFNDDHSIKKQDAVTVFKSIFSSTAGLQAAVSFLDSNFTEVVALGPNIWPEILYTVAEKLYTDDHVEWLNNTLTNKIFDDHMNVKLKARTLTSVNNYWANNFLVYVKEVLLSIQTTTTTEPTTTESVVTQTDIVTTQPSSVGTTTSAEESPTTTDFSTTPDAANVEILFSNVVASIFIFLLVSILN